GCADDTISPPPQSTIQGRIEDYDGRPVEGVVVIVGHKPPVTTDTEGSFRVDGVGSTYDLTLLPGGISAYHYAGLSRRDPFFRVPPRTSRSNTATITGTVPVAADKTTQVFFAPNNLSDGTPVSPYTGTFRLTVWWSS